MINKNIIENAYKILNLVHNEQILFTNAKTNIFKNIKVSDVERREIVRLAGSELRHHLALHQLSLRLFGELNDELLFNVLLMFTNNAYTNSLPKKDYLSFVVKLLKDNSIQFDEKYLEELCLDNDFKRKIIPEEFDKESFQYLSYKFNTPKWVCKMWQKQYGHKILVHTLRSFMKSSSTTVRISGDEDEFLTNHNDFIKTDVPGILQYVGKDAFKNSPAFVNHEAYLQKKIVKEIFDKLLIDEYQNFALYLGSSIPAYKELVTRFNKNIQMDILFLTFQDYYKAKKDYLLKHSNKVKIYESNPSMLKSCVSEKVDLFFVLPRSTNFDLFRVFPDYFLRCKQEDLDSIISEQKTVLQEASELVNDNGYLVYTVFTLNKKESKNVIKSFLEEHKDYILLEDNQLFSFGENDSIAYYAILKKEVKDD